MEVAPTGPKKGRRELCVDASLHARGITPLSAYQRSNRERPRRQKGTQTVMGTEPRGQRELCVDDSLHAEGIPHSALTRRSNREHQRRRIEG